MIDMALTIKVEHTIASRFIFIYLTDEAFIFEKNCKTLLILGNIDDHFFLDDAYSVEICYISISTLHHTVRSCRWILKPATSEEKSGFEPNGALMPVIYCDISSLRKKWTVGLFSNLCLAADIMSV